MATPNVNPNMEYRRLGNTGLQVSVLSFGSWVTFDTQLDTNLALECMSAAGEAGCNFFDNAEVYADGVAEQIMGAVLAKTGWDRSSYLVSTKIFWGGHPGPDGEIVGQSPLYDEDLLLVEVDPERVRQARLSNPVLREEKLDLTVRETQRLLSGEVDQ